MYPNLKILAKNNFEKVLFFENCLVNIEAQVKFSNVLLLFVGFTIKTKMLIFKNIFPFRDGTTNKPNLRVQLLLPNFSNKNPGVQSSVGISLKQFVISKMLRLNSERINCHFTQTIYDLYTSSQIIDWYFTQSTY